MILPIGASSFQEAMQMCSETYHHLKVPTQAIRSVIYLRKLILVKVISQI